ncbi:hypothetical protein FB45DRAFT_1138610 [Roridomyces roridus]|uniref:Uncharacterized protein n=1 Tax=Roridomyces roridus TaxID=1738132 RepID=A0AAD7FSI0_9AGAR|nr:hypothetical protein FB45DRAFT_1138610 [Roridomyces roridus]
MQFQALAALILTAFALKATAIKVMSVAEMKHWIATTDADLTFIGEPVENIGLSPLRITVVYCSQRTFNVCGGACNVYTGGETCIDAPNTNCLSATANVASCDSSGCFGSCDAFASCGTRLDNNFCFTPGTASISVPPS